MSNGFKWCLGKRNARRDREKSLRGSRRQLLPASPFGDLLFEHHQTIRSHKTDRGKRIKGKKNKIVKTLIRAVTGISLYLPPSIPVCTYRSIASLAYLRVCIHMWQVMTMPMVWEDFLCLQAHCLFFNAGWTSRNNNGCIDGKCKIVLQGRGMEVKRMRGWKERGQRATRAYPTCLLGRVIPTNAINAMCMFG